MSAAKKPAAARFTLSGVITKVELKLMKPFAPSYDRSCERYDVKLMIAVRTDAGRDFWFYTPATDYHITTSGPFSVACVEPNDWVTRARWDCEGSNGARGLGDSPVSRVAVGDRIDVTGRFKADTRFGTMLSHVKRTDYSFAALSAAYSARCSDALLTVPTTLPATETPPTIPGVEWSHIGGWYGVDYPAPAGSVPSNDFAEFPDRVYGAHHWIRWDSKVTNYALLIAHVEHCDPTTVRRPE